MTVVTADLSQFGYRELELAAELLTAYAHNGKPDFFNDGLTLNFNTNSGVVFLSDEEYNVGVMRDGQLVEFFSCPQCGNEGYDTDDKENASGEDFPFKKYEGFCSKECFDKNQ